MIWIILGLWLVCGIAGFTLLYRNLKCVLDTFDYFDYTALAFCSLFAAPLSLIVGVIMELLYHGDGC